MDVIYLYELKWKGT